MKKRGVLLLGLTLLLTACKQDPMIKLNPDVQASIEKKQSERKQNMSETEKTSDTTSSDNTAIQSIDRSQWKKLAEDTVFDLANYVPNEIDQLKQFTTGEQTQLVYTDYVDESGQLWQLRTLLPDNTYDVAIYRLLPNKLEQVSLQLNTTDVGDHLGDVLMNRQRNAVTLLQAPLQVGTTWETELGDAAITALYESVTLGQTTYQEVVEVTVAEETQDMRYYYAAGIGLILEESQAVNSQTSQIQLALQRYQANVNITQKIQIAEPTEQGKPLLQSAEAELTWKTNQPWEQTWTQLFRDKKWLNNKVSVNAINVQADLVEIDFTPGIVAAMNQHKATEKAVIPAIVQTIANYYHVKQVKITVNGSILAPDQLEVQPNGIWKVEAKWLTN